MQLIESDKWIWKRADERIWHCQNFQSALFYHQFPLDIFSFPVILIKDNY